MEIGTAVSSPVASTYNQPVKQPPASERNETAVQESSESGQTQTNEGERRSQTGRIDVFV